LLVVLFIHTVDGDWVSHPDPLAYVGYEVDYPDDDFDELELQEVFCGICYALFAYLSL